MQTHKIQLLRFILFCLSVKNTFHYRFKLARFILFFLSIKNNFHYKFSVFVHGGHRMGGVTQVCLHLHPCASHQNSTLSIGTEGELRNHFRFSQRIQAPSPRLQASTPSSELLWYLFSSQRRADNNSTTRFDPSTYLSY